MMQNTIMFSILAVIATVIVCFIVVDDIGAFLLACVVIGIVCFV